MQFDFDALSAAERYKLLTATVVPRPLAWVTTRSADGISNAAPYSFFNVMGSEPPLVALGILAHDGKRLKDTAANIEATGVFVVNLVDETCADAMNATSADLPDKVSELDVNRLATIECDRVNVPRIVLSSVSFECELFQSLAVSERQRVILGRVLAMHVADELVTDVERLHIDLKRHAPIGRMGGSNLYCRTHDRFRMERP